MMPTTSWPRSRTCEEGAHHCEEGVHHCDEEGGCTTGRWRSPSFEKSSKHCVAGQPSRTVTAPVSMYLGGRRRANSAGWTCLLAYLLGRGLAATARPLCGVEDAGLVLASSEGGGKPL